MYTRHALTALALAALLPGSPGSPLAAQESPTGRGVLLLKDGRRLAGVRRAQAPAGRVVIQGRRGSVTVPADRVVRWVPEKELRATWNHLAGLPSAARPFAQAQRAVWALEHGLDELAWPLVAAVAATPNRPAVYGQMTRLALPRLVPNLAAHRGELARGRLLLQAVTRSPKDARDRAREGLARRELARLLDAEAARLAQAKARPNRTLHALCRLYAEDGVGGNKRLVARRVLLGRGGTDRAYVFRMTMRTPPGSRSAAVVADIRQGGYKDEAAAYLARVTERVKPGLMLRGVRVLGALGSAEALPALHRLRSRIAQGRVAMRRAGGGRGGVPRSHVAILNQQSYVKDFDVEIASSAFIADPIVGVVNSGVVLDVTLVGVEIHRFLGRLEREVDRAIAACRR